MSDSRTKLLRDVYPGDEIIGTVLDGKYRYYTRTKVKDVWTTLRVAYRITLADGTELVASGDHRFLTDRGWKYVMPFDGGGQRPFLTFNNSLVGVGEFATPYEESWDYRSGYLCGMVRGDAHFQRYKHQRDGRPQVQHRFRLALVDLEALQRAKRYLEELLLAPREYAFQVASGNYKPMRAIRTFDRGSFERIEEHIAFPSDPDIEWRKGFLAGIFDAEGSRSCGVFRISNSDEQLLRVTMESMQTLGFDVVLEPPRDMTRAKPVSTVRLRGGLREHLRFLHTTGPAITRKWDIDGVAVQHDTNLRVVSIEKLGLMQLFDMSTETGDFVANGVISHNCYARPNHEYLDMGAGTDFDTKIVIKPRAAELLREAFEKPSWKGELIMFSGVTDCYQAIEKDLELTKQCLEVCLEYRNPVSIITKSALVERDVELIAELAREAGVTLNVSLSWTDAELARTIEPWAASPQRRLKVLETFAKAGVPVGIMMAPIIPGLNDSQMVKLLELARDAGAQWAGYSLLRLPGAVNEVFTERLRVSLPLVADRVLHRVIETRGGQKLYDSEWGVRHTGVGVYAQTIATMFETTKRRLGFGDRGEPDPVSRFRRPEKPTKQLSLF